MIYPSFAQAKELGAKGNRIPVKMELYADTLTPVLAVRRLKKAGRHCFLLESAQRQRRWGRYSFLGYEPVMEITCRNGTVKITAGSTVTTEQTEHPGMLIRKIMEDNRAPRMEEMPPFCGGLVGYFSYDYLKYSEPSLMMDAPDEEAFQDADLMLFDKVVAFDHYRQKVILIVNIKTDNISDSYRKAELTLKKMAETLIHGELAENPPLRLKSSFRYLFGKKEYCGIVERAKQYIREGDIFQVVLSNRIEADIEGSLFDTYRILRSSNPSPYMFYLSSDELEIAGASPETLVRLENGVLHTYPLAGTKKRGSTREEDLALEQNLLSVE